MEDYQKSFGPAFDESKQMFVSHEKWVLTLYLMMDGMETGLYEAV